MQFLPWENFKMSFKTSKALHKAVQEALLMLPSQHAEVLRLRCGLCHTLQEVARIVGLTRERIRQMQSRALWHTVHPDVMEKLAPFIMEPRAKIGRIFSIQVSELMKLNADIALLRGLQKGDLTEDLKTELKARLVTLLKALEKEEWIIF